MRLYEITNKKERVDEVLPAVIGGVVRAAPYVWKGIKHSLPYLKKLKGVGPKVHAATEIGKKAVKRSPPTHGDGSELDKTAMVPGPQAYHKNKAVAIARPTPQGKLSPAAGAAIAQAQQAQRKRQRP